MGLYSPSILARKKKYHPPNKRRKKEIRYSLASLYEVLEPELIITRWDVFHMRHLWGIRFRAKRRSKRDYVTVNQQDEGISLIPPGKLDEIYKYLMKEN